jgi:hypothetical protein
VRSLHAADVEDIDLNTDTNMNMNMSTVVSDNLHARNTALAHAHTAGARCDGRRFTVPATHMLT